MVAKNERRVVLARRFFLGRAQRLGGVVPYDASSASSPGTQGARPSLMRSSLSRWAGSACRARSRARPIAAICAPASSSASPGEDGEAVAGPFPGLGIICLEAGEDVHELGELARKLLAGEIRQG